MAAGCLVTLLCLVTAGVGWVAMRRWAAAEQATAERAELQAMQRAAAASARKSQEATETAATLPAKED